MSDTLESAEPDVVPKKPKRRSSGIRFVTVVVVLFVVGLMATGVLPLREYLDRDSNVEAAQVVLDRLTDENEALSADIEALYTDQELERLAREQYGLVRPGETGYVVIPSEDTAPADSAPPEPAESVTEDRSFFHRLWDFVTGNDQANNG